MQVDDGHDHGVVAFQVSPITPLFFLTASDRILLQSPLYLLFRVQSETLESILSQHQVLSTIFAVRLASNRIRTSSPMPSSCKFLCSGRITIAAVSDCHLGCQTKEEKP